MRPPILKGDSDSTQLVNPFGLNQAILIGLSPEIPGLDKSIQKLQQGLLEPVGIFSEFDIETLTDLNKSGNRTLLVHRLNALAEGSNVTPFKNLVLYFVGHAEKNPSYRILLPERMFSSELPTEERDWLTWETLCEWLAPIRARNVLIILDTCHANQLNNKKTLKWLQRWDAQEPGQKMLLASGSETAQSWEREWSCFFTEGMLEGLGSWSARNDRGAVDVDTLSKFLFKRVPKIAKEKTNKDETKAYPFRVSWPENPPFPMELTSEKERNALDEPLKNALLEGRCLLWAGENLKNRATPKKFPPRLEWENSQRDLWLDYADSQRAPGVASMQLASFGLSIIDSGVDTSVHKACRKKDHKVWVPLPGTTPPPKEQNTLIRLCGEPNTDHFAYEWEDLDYRFNFFLDWLSGTRRWDTLLLLGFPFEELAARNWLRALLQVIPHVWLAFPYDEGHDRAYWFNEIGIKLIFAQDQKVLKLLKEITRVAVKHERTATVRTVFPKKAQQKGRDIASTPNPYRGLLPFGELHYDTFYGRAHQNSLSGDLRDLFEDILHHQKVLLYGESGCGKTSLIQAGLLPVLQKTKDFRVFYSDAINPLHDLAQKIADESCFIETPNAQNVLERIGYLSKQTGRPVLICIDHIERALLQTPLMKKTPHDHPTIHFLQTLEEAVKQLERAWPTGNWRLLLSIRKDAYVHLKSFIQRREQHRTRAIYHRELSPLGTVAAKEAIVAPIPAPFSIEDKLVERLLIDLRHWQPGREPAYNPFWLQIVCRQLFEKARKAGLGKNGDAKMTLAHYKPIEGGFQAWLHDWLFQKTLAKLPKASQQAAKDILSMLLTEQGARRHRSWEEIAHFLLTTHGKKALEEAKELLLNQQILRERRIIHGPPQLEITHDAIASQLRLFSDQDLALTSQVMGHLSQDERPLALPKPLLKKIKGRAAYLDRISPNQRQEVEQLQSESLSLYRKQATIRSGALLVLLILGVAAWLYIPRSLNSTIDQHIAGMLQSKQPGSKKNLDAIKFFKTDQAIGVAKRKLSKLLLQKEGNDTCTLLKALHEITRGRVGEVLRMSKHNKDQIRIKKLKCPSNSMFKQMNLRNVALRAAQLPAVDLIGASLQEINLEGANLEKSRLLGANLLKSNFKGSNLKGANLEGAQFQYTDFTGADVRGAKFIHSALLGTKWRGALLSGEQFGVFVKSGATLQNAVCLSLKPSAGFLKGTAIGCYQWHRHPGPAAARPSGCPSSLKGPILAFPSLTKDGRCPDAIQRQMRQLSSYCPPDNKAACKIGKSCRGGVPKDCEMLAKMYMEGKGVKRNPEAASLLYQRACLGKIASSCMALGQLYHEGKDLKRDKLRALDLFEQGCTQGSVKGCFYLGQAYEKGQLRKTDLGKAEINYKQACQGQIIQACMRLGLMYQIGKGPKKNAKKSARFYQKACDKNDGRGCYWSARFQLKKRNKRKAKSLFNQAKELLDSGCAQKKWRHCALLGQMQAKGRGMRKNAKKALKLYRKACQGQDGVGCNQLGSAYYYGRGTRKRKRRAANYYRRACQYQSGEGCINLGNMYERGKGLRKNKKRAFEFYRKSCALYYGWGCNDLAELYHTSKGQYRDREKAKKLYKKACRLGVIEACK